MNDVTVRTEIALPYCIDRYLTLLLELQYLSTSFRIFEKKFSRNYRFCTIKRRQSNWIGHILCTNCLLKQAIEGKIQGRIEMTGRRKRRRKQLLDDLKEKRRHWKLKQEALDRTLWRTLFGRGFEPVVKTDYRMNDRFCRSACMYMLDITSKFRIAAIFVSADLH
jgi:hypothetical protein